MEVMNEDRVRKIFRKGEGMERKEMTGSKEEEVLMDGLSKEMGSMQVKPNLGNISLEGPINKTIECGQVELDKTKGEGRLHKEHKSAQRVKKSVEKSDEIVASNNEGMEVVEGEDSTNTGHKEMKGYT